MKNYLSKVAIGLLIISSVGVSSVQAQSSFANPGATPKPGIQHVPNNVKKFGAKTPGMQQDKKKVDVPDSMQTFVDRCSEAGGGLISIDGHYDCVKPSGEPIPDW